MADLTFDDPHHVTAGFLGVPGDRTFFLQVEDVHQRVDVLAEKEQVAGLGDLVTQLLLRVDDAPATDWDRDAMALREPVDPRWRVGDISAGVDPDGDRFVVELREFVPEVEEDEVAPEGELVRFSMDHDQARRFAAHAEEVVGAGRPRCELCGRPTDRDGSHVCPSTNGHGTLTR